MASLRDPNADFSGVTSSSSTRPTVAAPRADFSGVTSSTRSTAQIVGGSSQRYTVQAGDTLSAIAKAHYGRASAWRAIFDANRDVIDDPDLIHPGQALVIPADR